MKKVVVTGSQGFIGGYLVDELLKAGYFVVGIDNYSKYGKVSKPHDSNKNFQLVEEDLALSNKKLLESLKGASHLIANAAKIGGITYFHSYAYDLLATNERIMANTCDAAIEIHKSANNSLQKVTYMSSSMVYEGATTWPSSEGDQLRINPPESAYGFQKLAVEYFANAAYDQYGLPFTILRPFNCVGIGEARAINSKSVNSGNIQLAMSHVLPDLVQKVLKGQDPLHILGDGNQIRHYTYGGDLARGIVMSLENKNALNNDFNLSTKKPMTVVELAEIVWNKIYSNNKKFSFVCDAPFPHDVRKRIPNTAKARDLLGFSAETSIEVVLDEVIPWIKNAISLDLI